MIVVGNHKGTHLKALFLGSTATHVMATASCPVFVAGPRPEPTVSHEIAIEPACAQCLERRAATSGRNWWCERHSEHHSVLGGHVYSYQSELPFGQPDMSVNPTIPN
jgi:hypothetical protein